MRISHKYKFIFFCNPKTGSESIRKLLNPYTDVFSKGYLARTVDNPFYSHITPLETRQIFSDFGWDFDAYQKFIFVRNPWARLVSLYEMIFGKNTIKPTFTEWIFTIKPYGSGGGGEDWQRWRKYGTYSLDNFATDQSKELLVDKVIKLEDINLDLIPYLKKLNLPNIDNLSIPHINRTQKFSGYTQYYVKETEKHVEQLYSFDINKFGYRFED